MSSGRLIGQFLGCVLFRDECLQFPFGAHAITGIFLSCSSGYTKYIESLCSSGMSASRFAACPGNQLSFVTSKGLFEVNHRFCQMGAVFEKGHCSSPNMLALHVVYVDGYCPNMIVPAWSQSTVWIGSLCNAKACPCWDLSGDNLGMSENLSFGFLFFSFFPLLKLYHGIDFAKFLRSILPYLRRRGDEALGISLLISGWTWLRD